jgi:hypothetical protein
MPGFNQKGPAGQGPMTGRRMGRCTNYGAGAGKRSAPVAENPGETIPDNIPDNTSEQERGFGQGRGHGFGRGRGGSGRGQQNRFRGNF